MLFNRQNLFSVTHVRTFIFYRNSSCDLTTYVFVLLWQPGNLTARVSDFHTVNYFNLYRHYREPQATVNGLKYAFRNLSVAMTVIWIAIHPGTAADNNAASWSRAHSIYLPNFLDVYGFFTQ